MLQAIRPAGYIVVDNEAIWGAGPTSEAAWNDMLNGMKMANVRVITEPDEDDLDSPGTWTRESNFHIQSASAALLAQVEQQGGAISWRRRNGVCCTREEEEGE